MAVTASTHRALADLRHHWATVAAYDVYCARRADALLALDRRVSNTVLVATTISSLGIFTSLVAERPDLWARIVVFAITGVSAVLTALRQQNKWAESSGELRVRGEGWNRLRSDIGDCAQQVLDGKTLPTTTIKRIDDRQAELLRQHPEVSTKEFAEIRAEMAARFRDVYES